MPRIIYNPLESEFDYVNKATDFKGNFKPSSGIWAYASAQYFSGGRFYHQGAPSTDFELANKKYVDDQIIAGGGYTDEQAQDAVGTILGVGFVYNDAGNTITLESYIASSSAISRFADSSNIRTRFPGSSNLNRTLVNTISSNLDLRIDSLFNWSSNKGVYYPSGIGAGLSGSYSAHRQDATIHFTKSSIDDDYQGSSQAIAKFADSSNIRFRFIGSSQGIARFAGSSQINRSLLNSISSNLDSRIDNLFSWSSAALTLYGASSHTHGAFYGWSGATGFYSVSSNYLGHSSNRVIHYPSSQLLGWLNALYQESGTSSTSDVAWSGAYQFTAVSSLSKTRLDSIFNYSSAARGLFANSSNINRTLLNTISSNLDTRIDSLFNFSANKSLYPASSQVNRSLINSISSNLDSRVDSLFLYSTNARVLFTNSSQVNRALINLISSNIDTRIDNLFGWSSNAKNIYADSSNIRFRFPGSSNVYNKTWIDSLSGSIDTRIDALGSFNPANYIISTNAISRFADSANIRFRFKASSAASTNFKSGWANVSSTSIITHSLGYIPTSIGVFPSGDTSFGCSVTDLTTTTMKVHLSISGTHIVNWHVGSIAITGYNSESDLTSVLNDNYPASSQVNRSIINSISSNLDSRIDNLFSWSSNALTLYGASSHTHGAFYGWSGASGYYNVSSNYLGHSSNRDIHYPSSQLLGWLNALYQESGTSATADVAWSGAYQFYVVSSLNNTQYEQYVGFSSNKTLYAGSSQVSSRFSPSALALQRYNQYTWHSGNKFAHITTSFSSNVYASYKHSANSSLHSFNIINYITSTNAIAIFAGSANINRALVNSISSNLDTRVDSLFNFSSNKGLYRPSSGIYHYISAQRISSGIWNKTKFETGDIGYNYNEGITDWDSARLNFQYTQLVCEISGINIFTSYVDNADPAANPSNPLTQFYTDISFFGDNKYIKGLLSLSSQKISGGVLRSNSLVGPVLNQFVASTTAIGRYYPSTTGKATSGSLHNLWNWSSNKSWYANSSNVRYRFQASSLSYASYKHSANRTIHTSSQRYSGGTVIGCVPLTFSLPNIQISANQNINLTRFRCPSTKSAYLYQAGVLASGGTCVSGMWVQMLANSTLPLNGSHNKYKTSSQYIQQGNPLAVSNAGDHIEIRFMFSSHSTGLAGKGLQFGSAFAQVGVY